MRATRRPISERELRCLRDVDGAAEFNRGVGVGVTEFLHALHRFQSDTGRCSSEVLVGESIRPAEFSLHDE